MSLKRPIVLDGSPPIDLRSPTVRTRDDVPLCEQCSKLIGVYKCERFCAACHHLCTDCKTTPDLKKGPRRTLDYQDAATEGPLAVDPKLCPICTASKPKSLSRRSYRCEHTMCAGCCRVLHPEDCKEHIVMQTADTHTCTSHTPRTRCVPLFDTQRALAKFSFVTN